MNEIGFNWERKASRFKMTEEMQLVFARCGVTSEMPHEMVIPRLVLKKLISEIGIKKTLCWINGEDAERG